MKSLMKLRCVSFITVPVITPVHTLTWVSGGGDKAKCWLPFTSFILHHLGFLGDLAQSSFTVLSCFSTAAGVGLWARQLMGGGHLLICCDQICCVTGEGLGGENKGLFCVQLWLFTDDTLPAC